MAENTYSSSIPFNLARFPQIDKAANPELYEELVDIHDAIERLIGVSDMDNFFLDVAAGRVSGSQEIRATGQNPGILVAGGYETIWDGGGVYVPPTVARLHDITSANAGDAGTVLSSGSITSSTDTIAIDTSATFITDGVVAGDHLINDTQTFLGIISAVTSETALEFAVAMRDPNTGAPVGANDVGDSYRVVTTAAAGVSFALVTGLDAAYLDQREFVVLNGVANVATVNSYARQFRLRVFGSGSTDALGNITSTAQVDGTVSSQVNVNNNQSLSSVYTIPINKEAFVFQWWGSLSNKTSANSSIRLRVGNLSGISYTSQARALDSTGSSEFDYIPPFPIRLIGGIDVWAEADTSTNNLAVTSGLHIMLEDR